MFNAAATAILNRDGPDCFDEVLVPAASRALILPGGLGAVHRALFGPETRPERFLPSLTEESGISMRQAITDRLVRYLTVLHGYDDYHQAAIALDPRLTYDPDGWMTRHITGYSSRAELADVVADLETSGDAALKALFGADEVEPYASWRRIWETDLPLPRRLGAALLAFAYRVDALRTGGV